MDGLNRIVKEGKARYIGISNCFAYQLAKANALAERKGFARFIAIQGHYTVPYFLLGLILSAVFQRYVPAEVMTGLFEGNEAWGVLMAATIGVPLYACGGGTIPLLQQWLWEGMSVGGAASFMLTGPATKITNLGALKIILGTKRFCLYLAYSMLFSFAAGLLVNRML